MDEAKVRRWHIQSGDLKGEAEAPDAEQAFLSLLESQNPQALGRIVQAYKINDNGKRAYSTTVYISTEAALERAGLMATQPDESKG